MPPRGASPEPQGAAPRHVPGTPRCRPAARPRNPKVQCRSTSLEPKRAVPAARPCTQSAALPHVPGTLQRSGRVSGVQRKKSARSALPSCLKAVTSRCAAHLCAVTRTRFRCAAPFREWAAWLHVRGVAQPCISPPHPRHPGRSAAKSRDLSPTSIGSQSPHPEEQTRSGLRLEGRGLAGRDGSPCWNPSSFETPCVAAWLLRMRGNHPQTYPPHLVIPAAAKRRAGIPICRRRNLPGRDPGSSPG